MSVLCFIDTETTGLDPRIHQPWEVCVWLEHAAEPDVYDLAHNLTHADQQALKVGGYFEHNGHQITKGAVDPKRLAWILRGVTLVGSNPAFDAAMLTRYIGTAVWHHRMIDVAQAAMWVYGWDRPRGLKDVSDALREDHFDIPEPDHTAEGDVRTTRAVYEALRSIREGWKA